MSRKAFTLIELMVVVAMILIIAAAGIPMYLRANKAPAPAAPPAKQETKVGMSELYDGEIITLPTGERIYFVRERFHNNIAMVLLPPLKAEKP